MIGQKLVILQSGFLTLDDEKYNTFAGDDNIFRNYVLNKSYMGNLNQYAYSKNIKDYYAQLMGSSKVLRDFNFREQLLIEAFRLFGFDRFTQWLGVQSESKFLNGTHLRFIEDTYNFVFTGQRQLAVTQWINLIDASTTVETREVTTKLTELTTRYSQELGEMGQIVNFINQWVCQPDGFQDLLVSLYVIFGDRGTIKLTSG